MPVRYTRTGWPRASETSASLSSSPAGSATAPGMPRTGPDGGGIRRIAKPGARGTGLGAVWLPAGLSRVRGEQLAGAGPGLDPDQVAGRYPVELLPAGAEAPRPAAVVNGQAGLRHVLVAADLVRVRVVQHPPGHHLAVELGAGRQGARRGPVPGSPAS